MYDSKKCDESKTGQKISTRRHPTENFDGYPKSSTRLKFLSEPLWTRVFCLFLARIIFGVWTPTRKMLIKTPRPKITPLRGSGMRRSRNLLQFRIQETKKQRQLYSFIFVYFELLQLNDFCNYFVKTSESIRITAISKLLLEIILFYDYDLSDEHSLWHAHYGLPVYASIYIKRFIYNVPKKFITNDTSVGIILLALVSAR